MSKDAEHIIAHDKAKNESASGDAYKDQPEKDIWIGTYSAKDMVATWVINGFITAGLAGLTIYLLSLGIEITKNNEKFVWIAFAVVAGLIWIVPLVSLVLKKVSIKYKLTTKRFVHGEGFFVHQTDRIDLIEIEDVVMRQNLVDRMVGVGSIKIMSTDASHPELWLHGIENAGDVRDKIDQARHEARKHLVHHRDS